MVKESVISTVGQLPLRAGQLSRWTLKNHATRGNGGIVHHRMRRLPTVDMCAKLNGRHVRKRCTAGEGAKTKTTTASAQLSLDPLTVRKPEANR
jgi:hypothetical protein